MGLSCSALAVRRLSMRRVWHHQNNDLKRKADRAYWDDECDTCRRRWEGEWENIRGRQEEEKRNRREGGGGGGGLVLFTLLSPTGLCCIVCCYIPSVPQDSPTVSSQQWYCNSPSTIYPHNSAHLNPCWFPVRLLFCPLLLLAQPFLVQRTTFFGSRDNPFWLHVETFWMWERN